MKKLFFISLMFTLNSSFGADISNKSIRVGNSTNPNPFSVCIANQAVNQILSTTHQYMRLLNSSPDLDHQPAMKATLAFITDKIGDSKKNIFRLDLTSLDTKFGWQLVQDSTGEIAPYSTYISSKGILKRADGFIVGEVDLSPCSEE